MQRINQENCVTDSPERFVLIKRPFCQHTTGRDFIHLYSVNNE